MREAAETAATTIILAVLTIAVFYLIFLAPDPTEGDGLNGSTLQAMAAEADI